jgi:DnaJ-class molecular chaperone
VIQQQQQQIAMMQAQQAAAATAIQPQVCPKCQGQGGLGSFRPVPRGHMHWKKDCPTCEGRCTTIHTIPCAVCKGKGGQGTFGPCEHTDIHFKSPCGACNGKGYTAPLGQPPLAVAAHPIMAQAVAVPVSKIMSK